jgi:hypothetical protein
MISKLLFRYLEYHNYTATNKQIEEGVFMYNNNFINSNSDEKARRRGKREEEKESRERTPITRRDQVAGTGEE